jgi:hypothetical protein
LTITVNKMMEVPHAPGTLAVFRAECKRIKACSITFTNESYNPGEDFAAVSAAAAAPLLQQLDQQLQLHQLSTIESSLSSMHPTRSTLCLRAQPLQPRLKLQDVEACVDDLQAEKGQSLVGSLSQQ